MPLGLAKDSMLNLAEMAHQKDSEDSEKNQDEELKLEDGDEETLVMRLATHEIATLEAMSRADHEMDEEKEDLTHQDEPEDDLAGQVDSFHSGTDSHLANRASAEASSERTAADSTSSSGTTAAYGSYPGFSVDYSEYEHYGDYSAYSGTPALVPHKNQSEQPFWCCLFPWFADKAKIEAEKDENDVNSDMVEIERSSTGSAMLDGNFRQGSDEDDQISTGSDILGERLSDKDRQAVLARLRLAQPDAKGPGSPTADRKDPGEGAEKATSKAKGKGLLNGIVPPENSAGKKGILKRASTISRNNLRDAAFISGGSSADGKAKRRSLFPAYETQPKEKKNLHVDFSPMARVLTVTSHKEMTEEEKAAIWWQRSNYEEFRRTGRMISKAMLEGGSEIWLATNQSWQTPNKDKQSTLKSASSLAERHAAFSKGDLDAKREYEETRDKWWHKFGHSRRGLEHIASIDEGRQRQNNVKAALKAVVDEQRRQKVFRREDPEKLRMVSLQHTSWARDLAMAAGASDADAVQMNFDEDSRKSREFYLLKFSRSNQMKVHNTQKASVPAFMKPALSMVQPSRLDANTVPQIRFRQSQNKKRIAPSLPEGTKDQLDVVPAPQTRADEDIGTSMAKQAAGFASGERIGNMSSVLTGMGAIPVAGGS